MEFIRQCIWAWFGALGFGIIFNVRGRNLFLSALGGLISWIIFIVVGLVIREGIVQYFIAAIVIAVYSEIMAVCYTTPAVVYLIMGMIPLVPGSNIFFTMQYLIQENYAKSIEMGIYTMAIAGSISMGILLASFAVQIVKYAAKKKKRLLKQ